MATDVGPPPTVPTETTFPIEVVLFAEAWGVSLEEANALLSGQIAQDQAFRRLRELVGEDMIVGGAFADFPRSDELTIFVIDEESVAVVEARLAEAGLHPTKTFVQVAPEEPPFDPWDWLEREPYAGYEWLNSPGPHPWGAWQLIDSNGTNPEIELYLGLSPRWSLEACKSYIGRILTSAQGTITLTLDNDAIDCGDSTGIVTERLLRVIKANEGAFEIDADDDPMVWTSTSGDRLVWQPLDESFEPGEPLYPLYPPNRSQGLDAWGQSPAPEMEGIWHLQQVGNKDPAAPVSLYVGVSTIGFEGQCNSIEGMFAISTDDHLAVRAIITAMGCSGAKGVVEDQIREVLGQDGGLIQVSVNDDVMTWEKETGPRMIWSR